MLLEDVLVTVQGLIEHEIESFGYEIRDQHHTFLHDDHRGIIGSDYSSTKKILFYTVIADV